MEQNQKQPQNSAIRANDTTETENNLFNRNCSVCRSGHLKEIHELRPTLTLVELAAEIKRKYGVELTKDSLSRHFQHYTKDLQTESTKSLLAKFDKDLESIAEHQKKTLFLAKISFDHIVERLENGSLELGVEDFEKMIKLYYAVLRDPDSIGDENIIAIFQRASQKMGVPLEQGVLIKTKKSEI